jgi:hypothetical protein
MAQDFIKVNRTDTAATEASRLLNYKNALRQALEQGSYILEIMNHNQVPGDFANIEGLFGLPVGKGQTVYDLINGSVGSMKGQFQTADAKNLTETLG